MAQTLNRRKLFNIVFKSFKLNKLKGDPLFEKYSRKISGRKYQNASSANSRVSPVNSGLNVYAGTWGQAEALHVLKRTGFGHRKTDLDLIMPMTMSAAVDTVLTIDNTVPSPPVNYDGIAGDSNGLAYGADWTKDIIRTFDNINATTNARRIDSLRAWTFGQMCNQDITIKEKMSLFWYHFLPVDFETVRTFPFTTVSTNSSRILYQYMKMFRDNATGNFKTLIRNMATQPAMMFYLNNQVNTKTAPDENFAREIMELFTLGKDPLSAYTESDIREAAKVLTGWRVLNLTNEEIPTTTFNLTLHDTSNKQFSAFFNNTVISSAGASELDALIDMIFSKTQVVSEYICRRLYRFFVYYDIDDTIEATIISPLAQTFVANNWEILPVLNQLFKSQHFYDMANKGVYIKSPFDLVVGTVRTFNLANIVSDPTNYNAQYRVWLYYNTSLSKPLEQAVGEVPNVAGWVAYNQSPAFHQYWINSSTVQKRQAFIDKTLNGQNLSYNGLTTRIQINYISFIQQFDQATCADPNLLVADCVNYLFPFELSTEQLEIIKTKTLLSNQIGDYYWTNAWNAYLSNPTTNNKSVVDIRLKSLVGTLIKLSEYQLT